jgi:hypothetical protein
MHIVYNEKARNLVKYWVAEIPYGVTKPNPVQHEVPSHHFKCC